MIREPALTVADRCDRCGAQAWVKVYIPYAPFPNFDTKVETALLFCGHDYGKHETSIAGKGYRVLDERAALNGVATTRSKDE